MAEIEVTAPETTPAAPTTSAEPVSTPAQFSDDTMFVPPGAKEPVQYGKWYRGLQSQLTRSSQEASRLTQAQAQMQRDLAAAQERIQRYEAWARSQSQSSQGADPLARYKTLTYLSGEDAYNLAQELSKQVGGYGQEFSKRDQILAFLAQELYNQRQQFAALQNERTEQGLQTKIEGWLSQLGIPTEAAGLFNEWYRGWEGNDLDAEAAAMIKERWDTLQRVFKAQEQKVIQGSRKRPFVPGKGGDGSAPKPLEIPANATGAQIADLLFPLMQGNET